MRTYALTHLNDAALLRDLDALVSQEHGVIASVIAHLAEVDARRLYLPAGYPSMYEYCVRKLGWSEHAALKRVRAARAARRFPAIFDSLAAGRLHLTAVVLLAPHLTAENADALLAEAAHRTKAGIEALIARWFPKPDVAARLEPVVPATPAARDTVPGSGATDPATGQLAPGLVRAGGSTDTGESAPPPRLAPLAPERFLLQLTIGMDTYQMLRDVQALLSHQVPSGDVAGVIHRALTALKEQLEKEKFAATARPRPRAGTHPSSANPPHVPASVKRAVWARDGGQCTFVNEAGERCTARSLLEFDHINPVACGGRATVDGMRLLCRGHNQYEADRRFGTDFMNAKRAKSGRASAPPAMAERPEARSGDSIAAAHGGVPMTTVETGMASTLSEALVQEQVRDVTAGLRALGFRAGEVRQAARFCETVIDTTLEERMRAALRFLCPASG